MWLGGPAAAWHAVRTAGAAGKAGRQRLGSSSTTARRQVLRAILGAGVGLGLGLLPLAARPADRAAAGPALTVYAAASLKDVLGTLGAEYTRRAGVPVKFSFAASSLLARQIEAGAPADVYVSADAAWTDYLARRGALAPGSARSIAGNRLVLVAPADAVPPLRIAPGFPLAQALGRGRLAVAEPDAVPAGRYARRALQSLGAWSSVADRLVRTEDVRGALALVARGEAPLGIVYATDARMEPRVRVVDTFPASAHPPIAYPAAVVRGGTSAASGFVAFLGSAEARVVFERFGFAPP
jgi:molybdate transport system substrate-binding protein